MAVDKISQIRSKFPYKVKIEQTDEKVRVICNHRRVNETKNICAKYMPNGVRYEVTTN